MLKEAVLSAYRDPVVLARTGPFVFQYAVEVLNPELLEAGYFRALNESGIAHCFNHWNAMVPLHHQMRAAAEAGGLTADFYIARLLTPLGTSYQNAEELFEPYDRVQAPNAQMRGDVLRLARRALSTGKRAFVTANNKAEGNSPLTMVSIGQLIVDHVVNEVSSAS